MKRLVALLLALGVSMTWAGAQPAIKSRGSKKDPFTFVQVSDPQLGFCAKGQDWQWTVGNLKTTVAQINALKPAFVIVTGDLVKRRDFLLSELLEGNVEKGGQASLFGEANALWEFDEETQAYIPAAIREYPPTDYREVSRVG